MLTFARLFELRWKICAMLSKPSYWRGMDWPASAPAVLLRPTL